MKTTVFDARQDLLIVEAHIVGPRGDARVDLVLDTGASMTILVPDVVDELGYSARDGYGRSTVSSPLGREYGYRLRVREFAALGFAFADFSVAVHDIADEDGFDGLLGWDFLQRFNLEIRPREGRIRAEPA